MITENVELHGVSVRRLWDACRKKNGLMLLTLVGLLCNYAKTAALPRWISEKNPSTCETSYHRLKNKAQTTFNRG